MASVVVSALGDIVNAYRDNNNLPLVGGMLLTQSGGINYPTYVEPTGTVQNTNPIILNSRGEIATSSGTSIPLYVQQNISYTFTLFDALGNQIWATPAMQAPATVAGILSALTQAQVGQILYPITTAETNVNVTPLNYGYPAGDLRRYGGDPTGLTDSSAAWQLAVTTGTAFIPAGTFQLLTGAVTTGTVIVTGLGPTSQLLCDANVLTVTNGTGSFVDNFGLQNITAPWTITRNPASWSTSALPSLAQSNTGWYQPCVNDNDVWSSLTAAQKGQQIGPVIQFVGIASGIRVSRITGRFVRIDIRDATDSAVMDCDLIGGKGQWGTITFDNWQNAVQRGSGNRAVNNRIKNGTFSGVWFAANDHFTMRGNVVYNCGESGVQTAQTMGNQFSASVGGATTGTLLSSMANGGYTFQFSDGEVRAVTVTNNTTATWTPALSANTLLTVSTWPVGTLNPQCFYGLVADNHCYQNAYDGIDCDSVGPNANDAPRNYHLVTGNHSFGNAGNGINADGQFNSYVGNYVALNSQYGIWGLCSNCNIADNLMIDNNQARVSSQCDILANGVLGLNKITGNQVVAGGGQNNSGIYATTANFISGNYGTGGSVFYFGNAGSVPSVNVNNIDGNTGLQTPQAFTLIFQNSGGTLQHIFYGDPSGSGIGQASRVIGATSGIFTSTPTGADASTAFAAGAKVGSGATNTLWINTAAQQQNGFLGLATVASYNIATTLGVEAKFASININGVTQQRLALSFFNTANGGAYALNTTNLTTGAILVVQFFGQLA